MKTKSVVYKITYLPFLDTEYPKYYIGSKYKWRGYGSYYGSVDSIQKYSYTNNLILRDWWRNEVKKYPENFVFEILEEYVNISKYNLLKKERKIQKYLNVVESDDYFNNSYAISGFCASKRSDDFKLRMSKVMGNYWKTSKDASRRKNNIKKYGHKISASLKEKWLPENRTTKMKNRKISGRPKGSKDLVKRKVRELPSWGVVCSGKKYKNAMIASFEIGICVTLVRRRCNDPRFIDWYYVK